jgi:hypothetical protein
MTSPPAPNRFISRAAGARNAVERAELLQMVPTCRTVYQVAHVYSNGVALQKSGHFWLPMLLCADFPAAYSPALTSFAELTEAGQQSAWSSLEKSTSDFAELVDERELTRAKGEPNV